MPDITGHMMSAIPIEIFHPRLATLRKGRLHSRKMSHPFHCRHAGEKRFPRKLVQKLQFCDKKPF
ncbi:hypothetical protein [Agrobacterium leguminum]|jgi:hypothetical protein|uniref:hypothetical protein n=1 Tax=Agrobacterium leguminum TaxID=2792015 RepID=UPI00220692DF|nr:hypothetical protein FY137_22975 [Agrobacterium tumefaciens]